LAGRELPIRRRGRRPRPRRRTPRRRTGRRGAGAHHLRRHRHPPLLTKKEIPMSLAITAEGLVKRYGKVAALDGMDLAVSDGITIAKRNTLKIRRAPDLLGGVVMLPIVFVLLYTYIFGSMIDLPGIAYGEYLMPGVFVLAIVTSAQITGYTLTQ